MEEGIEAMLCCWLYQLQEMGGPEVDKQDLIKGSVGSLKSNMKKSPSLGSISKVSSDPKARYNVSNTYKGKKSYYRSQVLLLRRIKIL